MHIFLWILKCYNVSRERKKKEKVHRKEKSRSRSVSPQAFRGRNTAMDAQEALARRYCSILGCFHTWSLLTIFVKSVWFCLIFCAV